MDDKKFDEIMWDYVDSARGSHDEDLKKLSAQQYTSCKKRKKTRLAWTAMALCFVCVIGISISLPFLIQTDNISEPLVFGLTEKDVVITTIENDDDFLTNNCRGLEFPSIASFNVLLDSIALKKNGEIIGLRAEMDIYDNIFNNISLYIYENEFRLDIIGYDDLDYEEDWGEINVKFKCENDLDGFVNTHLFFEKSSYVYYVKSVTYEALPPADLLDLIF